MNAKEAVQLFVEDYDQLRSILKNPTPSNLRNASAILRLFLLDQPSPLDLVAKQFEFKIRYHVSDTSSADEYLKKIDELGGPVFRTDFGSRTADINSPFPKIVIKKDEFLALEVAIVEGTRINVKDLITFVANNTGATHFGPASGPAKLALEKTFRSIEIGGNTWPYSAFRFAIQIFIESLFPLYARVRA